MYSFEEYTYARNSIDTRTFGLMMDPKDKYAEGDTKEYTWVNGVFIDLFNHRDPPDLLWHWNSIRD